MDPVSLAVSLMSAQSSSRAQIMAASFIKSNAESQQAVAGLLEASSQNLQKLAEQAAGLGANLDVTV
ncbi:hypothetical protein [Prosthecomicrobium sp. N25]|uniref:hypothetical protein n=1 Tax=Prosthecomicrobium sp. N25 TaxID=3129254 RepID=UPI0030782FE1